MKKKKLLEGAFTKTFETLHNKKLNRRDLLSTGLLKFSASLTFPTLASQIAKATEDCSIKSAIELSPLVTLNLSGGAGLASNVVPMDQGGQPLPSYNKMGLGKGDVPLDFEFGGTPFARGISSILTGIRANASPSTLLRTSLVSVCVRSRDDSTVNKFDITGMAAKAGVIGEILPNLGRKNSSTGTKNQFALVKPPSPLVVSNYTSVANALGVSGSLSQFSGAQKEGLFKLIRSISSSQTNSLVKYSGGLTLAKLINCATQSNENLISNPNPGIDPLANSALSSIWGINNATSNNSQDKVFATMVFNALNGNAGTVNLEMGGYDYHDNTRTTGDNRDELAGIAIGRILESAAIMGKPLFLCVTSDGAVASSVSDDRAAPWVSDRGDAGMAYMIAFHPTQKPIVSSYQLGHFTTGQVSDEQFLTGASPELAAAAMFANYLSFNKQIDLFNKVVPRTFDSTQLNSVLRFM